MTAELLRFRFAEMRAPVFFASCLAVAVTACGEASPDKQPTPPEAIQSPGVWLTTNGSYEVYLEWVTGPQTGMDNVVRMNIRPLGNATLPLQQLTVTPWMTVHGHGSGNVQPLVESRWDSAAGIYLVSNIFFVMSGPWDLKIALTDGTTSGAVVIPVTVPGI